MVDLLATVLKKPSALRAPKELLEILLPKLGRAVEAFANEVVIAKLPQGIPQAIVKGAIGAGLAVLKSPAALMAFVKSLRKPGTAKGFLCDGVRTLAAHLLEAEVFKKKDAELLKEVARRAIEEGLLQKALKCEAAGAPKVARVEARRF
jgi:hypothetical protein